MNKSELEQRFLSLVDSYKQVIYKVCFMYATDDETISDIYQEVVLNLLDGLSAIPKRKQTIDMGVSHQHEHLHLTPAPQHQATRDRELYYVDGRPLPRGIGKGTTARTLSAHKPARRIGTRADSAVARR